MPLQPNGGIFHLPTETAADVRAVFEHGLTLTKVGHSFTFDRAVTDLSDHFYYIGALHPQHFSPLQAEIVKIPDDKLANFAFDLTVWLNLMQGAADNCVEKLASRLENRPGDYTLEMLLAAICSPDALAELAQYAKRNNKMDEFKHYGFRLSADGKTMEVRFTHERQAVKVVRYDMQLAELRKRKHPIGLPVSDLNTDPQLIIWHYLTLDFAKIKGLPQTNFTKAHLVSPPLNWDWTVFTRIDADNTYSYLDLDGHIDEEEKEEMICQAEEYAGFGRGEAILLPYDDNLIYCNGHTQLTANVEGDVGGPPIGLYPNPDCRCCKRLMFHVATVTKDVREYGDGFRSLFICEDCNVVATQATSWN
jgi:hypothetical protein